MPCQELFPKETYFIQCLKLSDFYKNYSLASSWFISIAKRKMYPNSKFYFLLPSSRDYLILVFM